MGGRPSRGGALSTASTPAEGPRTDDGRDDGRDDDRRPPAPVAMDTRQEIRFAIVMYGGVSLAVYISGVAQELLHLVRATAPDPDPKHPGQARWTDDDLTPVERVYREAARRIDDARDGAGSRSLGTRFVVDVLSGTSAGGINAVFLGKALANDQPLEQLKELWLREGDFSHLVNDGGSAVPGVADEVPPQSLLNSRRMYVKLLEGLSGMDRVESPPEGFVSPYVEELDVFVTATDLAGLSLPLQLANALARETRHRSVFQFSYASADSGLDPRNDFTAANDPFLAFAARCTSSFPFAFEPMRLDDIDDLLAAVPPVPNTPPWRRSDHAAWAHFTRDYQSTGADPNPPDPFAQRSFGDGGALDNKPFSWATESLLRRRADVVVDRKLVYVEPDPDDRVPASAPDARPDAIKNVELQALMLPRQETIRDDLERVLERNRQIVRIDRILRALDEQLTGDPPPEPEQPWSEQYATDEPPAYGGYLRLKVASVTDDLTLLIASVAGFSPDSSDFDAIRTIVRVWRDAHFSYAPAPPKESFNAFLVRFDLAHRLRRLVFLMRRIDGLYATIGEPAARVLTVTGDGALAFETIPAAAGDDARAELLVVKRLLAAVHRDLRILGRKLRSQHGGTLWPFVAATHITRADLDGILRQPDDDSRRARAAQIVEARASAFDDLAAQLTIVLARGEDGRPGTIAASHDLEAALRPESGGSRNESPGALVARRAVDALRLRFDAYDEIAYPLQYGTDVGETDVVEIIRVSPRDATNLVTEDAQHRKLRGWQYGHFGGFLDTGWRANDIMWGRLDAAETILRAVLPAGSAAGAAAAGREQENLQKNLIEAAQAAIVREELGIDLAEFRRSSPAAGAAPTAALNRTVDRSLKVVGKMAAAIGDERGGLQRPPLHVLAALTPIMRFALRVRARFRRTPRV